jgi:hypothetical protein
MFLFLCKHEEKNSEEKKSRMSLTKKESLLSLSSSVTAFERIIFLLFFSLSCMENEGKMNTIIYSSFITAAQYYYFLNQVSLDAFEIVLPTPYVSFSSPHITR